MRFNFSRFRHIQADAWLEICLVILTMIRQVLSHASRDDPDPDE